MKQVAGSGACCRRMPKATSQTAGRVAEAGIAGVPALVGIRLRALCLQPFAVKAAASIRASKGPAATCTSWIRTAMAATWRSQPSGSPGATSSRPGRRVMRMAGCPSASRPSTLDTPFLARESEPAHSTGYPLHLPAWDVPQCSLGVAGSREYRVGSASSGCRGHGLGGLVEGSDARVLAAGAPDEPEWQRRQICDRN